MHILYLTYVYCIKHSQNGWHVFLAPKIELIFIAISIILALVDDCE